MRTTSANLEVCGIIRLAVAFIIDKDTSRTAPHFELQGKDIFVDHLWRGISSSHWRLAICLSVASS